MGEAISTKPLDEHPGEMNHRRNFIAISATSAVEGCVCVET